MNLLEAKLAETTPKRPLAVTVGAAAVTLVIIAGVLTGPTILSCANSSEGFGACFSGKLSDVGILPKPAPVAVAETTEPATQPAAETATPATTEAPATDTPAAIPDIIGPTFGLLRAQPDGSVVIAGSGKPGSEIEVFANDASIGKTKVESSGDWVLVPEKPLADSGVELTVGEAGSKERSGQSFVVVIDPAHKTEPLVVASVPGKASEVLQGLVRPAEAAGATQVAAAASPAAPAANAQPASEPSQEVATAAPEATSPAVVSPEPPAAAAPPAATENPVASEVPAAPAAAPASPSTPPAPVSVETQVATAEEPAAPNSASDIAAPEFVASIDAIEIDGDKNFFAGAGPEGATVRLYVDDAYVADSPVRGGRWLVEVNRNVLTKPSQLVRIDVLKPGSSDVASRAEVNFEIELPAGAQNPVAVAEATPPAAPAPSASEPAATPAPEGKPAAASQPAPAAAEAPAASAQASAPAAQAPAAETPVASAPSPTPETAAQPASPTASDVPTMVAVAVGSDPESQRFASGKAIIRSGDNLWTIARRVYGKGIKYTTIYEANTGQIRDPDWIYPGQVFDLPEDKAP